VVRAYSQEPKEEARAAYTINRALEFTMRGTRARALSSPSVELLTGLGFALAIYFAGTKGVRGDLTLGQFMGFMTSALLIYGPLKSAATPDEFAGRRGGRAECSASSTARRNWSRPLTGSRSR
jgi:subfamily B ATP-binding cassette protein MsbA